MKILSLNLRFFVDRNPTSVNLISDESSNYTHEWAHDIENAVGEIGQSRYIQYRSLCHTTCTPRN